MKNMLTPFGQIVSIICLLLVGNIKLSAQTFPASPGIALPGGKTIVITYEVDVIPNPCPTGTIPSANLSNQSNVSGSNFPTVQTDEPSNPAANPSPTLTPFSAMTIGNLVYKDNNKNGVFDAGDTGIDGVLLRLYLDDGDGVLDAGDGAALLTTTTAGGGLYLLTPECPGNYIVEVASSNFNAGGPLYDNGLMAALISSPVGGAPDPDNDLNNDDNGDPVAGFGVAAAALTVAYGAEPTTDGDALANTNLTVDFGFKVPTTVSIGDVTLAEGSGGGTTLFNFIVTRTDNTEAFTLDVNTMDGTASGTSDYGPIVAGTVSFTAGGALTANVPVLVAADNMVEANETFTVLLSNAPSGVILSDASGLGTINNDDAAVVTLSGGVSQNEGTSFVFTATLNNPVQGGFTVAYTTNNGTATTADLDYTDNDGSLVFTGTAGETKTITVVTTVDNKVELDETFTVALGAVTLSPGGVTTAGSPQTGTILNDDAAVVSISNSPSALENVTPQVWNVTLSNPVDVAVTVQFNTSNGTAFSAEPDYTAVVNQTVTFPANSTTTQNVNVTIINDTKVEADETYNGTISGLAASGRNVTIGTSTNIGTILNDDAATVTLTGGNSFIEGNTGTTPNVFTATLNNAVQGGFTVNYSTNDGTATTADNDYVDNDGVLTFTGTAGETKTFTVLINGDLNIEANETYTGILNSITGAPASVTIGGAPQVSTITNDEFDWGDAPTAAQSGFVGTYPTLTGANGARHTLNVGGLRLGATVDADVDGQPNANATGDGADEDGVTLPGSFITGISSNITVNSSGAGILNGWLDFNRDGDWADAGEQIFTNTAVIAGNNVLSVATPAGASVGASFARFRLATASGALVTGLAADGEVEDYQVNILNNAINIDNPSVAEGNAGTTNLVFTVTRTTNTTASSVDYAITGGTATSGVDYQPLAPGTINFTAGGSLTATITVVVNGDLIVENNETVIITLSNVMNGGIGANPGTGTINNDDAANLTLTGGIAQAETNAGTVSYTFTATLNNEVQGGFQVAYTTNNGTATAGTDYTDNDGTLTFTGTPGETKTITVLVNGDVLVELDETFNVALGAISATSATQIAAITIVGSPQTATITNDDAAVIAITANVSQAENLTPQVFTITLSNPVDVNVTVNVSTANGTATVADNDYVALTAVLITFNAGTTTSQVANVVINNDTKVEANETFIVAIGNLQTMGRAVTIDPTSTPRTGTIVNDDSAVVTLSGGTTVTEGNSGTVVVTFTATLNNAVQGGFTANYTTNDGTATTADNDYADNDGALVFTGTPGETKTFMVAVNGDLNIENNETFQAAINSITLAPIAGGVTIAGSPQTVTINNDELDWGDAPNAAQSGFVGSYPTLLSDSGPRHQELPGGLHLGATVDAEIDGQPNSTATGDGPDEDGVTLPPAFIINTSANITVNASGTGNLNAWMDFNRDGDFVDAGEQIFTNTVVNAGNNVLSVATPAGASLGTSFARFRLSTQVNSGIGGLATDGEVEDYQVSINNNTFSINSPSVVEGNAGTVNLVYTVTRSTNSTASSVDYAITGGTATSGTDYVALPAGTINFTAGGSLTATITVVVNGDVVVEDNETVIITLSNPVNGAVGGGPGTGTITNDDIATLTLSGGIAQNETNAGTVSYVFTATLNAAVQGGFQVAYTSDDGTATTADNDYVNNDGTLTFAGTIGETQTFTVLVNGDIKVELNETFTTALGAITATSAEQIAEITKAGTPQTATITNDDAAVVSILANVSQSEAITPQTFTVTLSNPVDVAVTVLFNTSDGTATTADNDYTGIVNQTVTFPAGTTTNQLVNVTIINDTKVEVDEVYNTAIGTLNASGRNVSLGTTTRTGTIVNNDHAAVTLSGGTSHLEGNTGTTPFVFTVQVNRAVQGGFTANYTTNDGTATTADNDYVDNDGSVAFTGTAGESHTITVLANGDLNIENNETFTVSLNGLVTMVLPNDVTIAGSPQTGTIQNDEMDWGDAPTAAQSGFAGTYPTLSADIGARHIEFPGGLHLGATVDADLDGQPNATATGDGADEDGVTLPAAVVINTPANITVNSSGTGLLDAWVDWNRDGDWADAGERVFTNQVVVAGNNSLIINIPATATLGNSFARFRVSSLGTSAPINTANDGEVEDYQVNIVNTQFNIDNPSVVEGNAGTSNLVFTISRTNNSTACSVNYAITGGTATTADLDYQVFAGGTASFTQGGALSQTVTVVVNGDLKVELDETVIMTLSNPVNGAIQNGTGTGTITNDDSGLITITSPSIVEGDVGTQNLVFNINMSAISDANVSFNWATANGTATSGSDYVANSGTITLTPGQTTATITIVINGDCTIEPNEVFTVVLSSLNALGRNITFSPAGATLAGTGTINNEDFLPVITFCPPNVTISCEQSSLPANTGTATATDDCPGVLVTSADITVGGNCLNNYVINRTWKATDNTNDMATCLQVITVRDITPPTISCPTNVTVTCASQVPFPNNEGGFQFADNCGGGVFITFVNDVIINQVCTNRFQVARTYRATDACGNSATCIQTITVFDNVAPQLNCPAPLTFQCASDVFAPNVALVTTTDNCAGGSTVTFVSDIVTNQTCVNKFTLTRTYQATDACGNSATCTQTIIVNDNVNPQIVCPAGITVQCASLVPVPNIAIVLATDNCSGPPVITFVNDAISNQTCINKFTVTRTYRATDLCGNSSTCQQTIIVNDNTLPTLTCPANVTVQCASLVPVVNTAGVVTADNCGPVPTVTHVGDVISNQTCVNRFIVTRTYRTTDACGNSATCNQTITVFDNTAPTLTCPANVTVQCAALVPVVNIAGVVTADNCGGAPTVTFVNDVITNQTCINRFIVNRTYRSTDVCGNSATCVQIITVFDNTAPVITFVDPLIANLASGGRFDVQCQGQDPNWSLPVLDESSVTTADNCAGNVTLAFSQLLFDEGNCPVDGYITMYKLTWTATDACGNVSTKFVFMALVDHIAPVLFNIPEDITVNCDEIPDPPTDVFATDECISASSIVFSAPPPLPGCQNGQVITRSWTATDLCGNKTTETQLITLIDVQPPVIQMLQPELSGLTDGTILEYTCSEGGIPEFFDDLNAESAFSVPSCGSAVTIKFESNTIHANNCKMSGYREQQAVHWVATDVCGNVANLTIYARLIDTQEPVILGVPDTACIDDLALNLIEATDDCGDPFLRYWDNKIPNPCGSGFAVRRTYEAYDNCGNYARDTAVLIPNDHIGPVMKFTNLKLLSLPPGEVLLVDCEGFAGDYTPFGVEDVEVADACAGVEVTFTEKVLESNGCSNGIVATLSLEWRATDLCGNVSTLTVQAFVIDQAAPVLVNFKAEVTIGCNDDLPAINATDNCGDVSVTIEESTRPGPCEFEYDVTRTITATDPCGNVTSATQVVHVGDGSGPVFGGVVPEICDDLSIPDVTAFDPCSGKFVAVSMTEQLLDTPCRDGKVYQRTWTATDFCGNVSTATQIIIVGDQTPPEIQIPTWSIILKYLDAPGQSFVNLSEKGIIDQLNDLDDGSVFVTDECDLQVIPVFTLDVTYSSNCEEDGYYEHRVYTWTATDICGNSSSITFDIYIMDDIAPVLLGVPNDATTICGQLPAVPFVFSDDPAQPVSIVYDQTILPGGSAGEFDVTRTWTGTDACGNVSGATQHITWIPDTFLECDILVPPLVECNSHGVVISSLVSGGLGGVTYEWEVIGQGFIQTGQGTPQISMYVGWTEITVILTITDAFGCTTTCSTAFDCLDTAINPFAGEPQTVNPDTNNDPGFTTVDDNEISTKLSRLNLWPNPVNGNVNLSFTSHANQEVEYRLINFLGQELLADKMDALQGTNAHKVDVSNIPEGSYLVELKTKSDVYTKVIVIMR
ncbi:MAG TPA: Calx-beta domain-containing protein [Saprospiraceae bacterium]|nr:Calx-beta domain-containing protein [Saprospiraceae bacterium]